jgi:hypothetical protein
MGAEAIAIAGVVVAIAAAGVGAYGASVAADNQEKAAKFNSRVQENQAATQRMQAAAEASRIDRRNKLIAGRQNAVYAKSGLNLSGSATDVIYDSKVQGEMDRLTALYTGKISSDQSTARSQLYTMQGDAAQQQGYWNMGSTVLTGVGSAASAYGSYRKQNNPDF